LTSEDLNMVQRATVLMTALAGLAVAVLAWSCQDESAARAERFDPAVDAVAVTPLPELDPVQAERITQQNHSPYDWSANLSRESVEPATPVFTPAAPDSEATASPTPLPDAPLGSPAPEAGAPSDTDLGFDPNRY
jgi:hypothetical protein